MRKVYLTLSSFLLFTCPICGVVSHNATLDSGVSYRWCFCSVAVLHGAVLDTFSHATP